MASRAAQFAARGLLHSASGQAVFAPRGLCPKGPLHLIRGLLPPAVSTGVKLTPANTPPDWNGLFCRNYFARH